MIGRPDEPLSNDELDWLEDFLCTRYGIMEFDHDADVGVFDVAALDGYLTAIVSGPETIPPSLWLADMDGEFETLWDSEEFFERVFSMMVRHMNSISSWLMADAPSHQPLYMLRQVRDGHYTHQPACLGSRCGGNENRVERHTDIRFRAGHTGAGSRW